MGSLDGRVAVVLGASRGIGKGAAIEAALAGAIVYVTGRTAGTAPAAPGARRGSLDQTISDIAAVGGRAVAVRCDATVTSDLQELYARVRAEQGRLDLVVHSVWNASAFGPTVGKALWELPPTAWDDIIQTGARAAYFSSLYAAPLLIDSGGGLVVNITGRGAGRYRYNVVYGVDKAATDKLTADLGHELRPHGVAVVSLWPSVTRTESSRATSGVDEWGWPDPSRSVDELETPRYTGRAVVALASDPEVMRRSGRHFWTAELGAAYSFTDENGRTHPVPAEADQLKT